MLLLSSLCLAREVSFYLFAEGENVVPFLDWWFLEGLLYVESSQEQSCFLLPSDCLRPLRDKRVGIRNHLFGINVPNSWLTFKQRF